MLKSYFNINAGKGPQNVPPVLLDGQPVIMTSEFRYLGHILTSDLKDNQDIERLRRSIFIVGNMIARKFFKASRDVKTSLFRSYCQSFYTCQLWTDYTRRAHDGIRVTNNNIFRHLMGFKRWCSASGMFAEARFNTFIAIQRSRIASFLSRAGKSRNDIVRGLAERLFLTKSYK